MGNPEKLATQGIQDEDKQNKNTSQYVLNSTMHTKTKKMSNKPPTPPPTKNRG